MTFSARAWFPLLASCLAIAHAQTIGLTSPPDGARPHSAWIAVEGQAAPAARVAILDNDALAAMVTADSTGRFERVLRLPAGRREIRVKSGDAAASVHVEMSAFDPPTSPAPYGLMQTGDVILAHDRDSELDALYHPTYTHVALYIGPDAEGAPLLLEAMPEANSTSNGPVAAVPLEGSLCWRFGDRVAVFRLAGGLNSDDRTRIVAWSRRTAVRGLPFRDAEFGDIYRAWLMWDPEKDQPRDSAEFESLLADLRTRLEGTDSYDCATLVWHAYRDSTAAHIDLAHPNRVVWGGAAGRESKRLAERIQPLLILPDAFALSGKPGQVNE